MLFDAAALLKRKASKIDFAQYLFRSPFSQFSLFLYISFPHQFISDLLSDLSALQEDKLNPLSRWKMGMLGTMSRWVLKIHKGESLTICSSVQPNSYGIFWSWVCDLYMGTSASAGTPRAECPASPPSSFWRSPRWGSYNHSTHTLGICTHGEYHLPSVLQET